MEGANEEGSIGRFIVSVGSVMIDLVLLIVGMLHQLFELSGILPCFCEVEGSEILIETVVLKILNEGVSTLSMLK